MRFLHLVIMAAVAVAVCPIACADGGANAAGITEAVKTGVSEAAPSAFSGNWLGAVFGFLAGAIPGVLVVLQKQAQDKWHMFHAGNAIAAAGGNAAPPADPAK